MQRDKSDCNEQPQQERHDPVHIVMMQTQSSCPPPSRYDPDGKMEPNAVSAVETRVFVVLGIRFARACGNLRDIAHFALLHIVDVDAVAFVLLGFLVVVDMVFWAWVWYYARLVRGSYGVGWLVTSILRDAVAMMKVLVGMFVARI